MSLKTLHSTKDFFRVWFTWKVQAIAVFLIIVGVVMAFSYIYTPVYVSTAKILLLPRTSEGAIISAGKDETRVSSVSVQDINTEIELLTSYEVLADTVRSFMKKDGGGGGGGGVGLRAKNKEWYKRAMDQVKYYINKVLLFLRLKQKVSAFDANVALLSNSLEVEPIAVSNIILVSLEAEIPKAATVVLNRLLETYIAHHNKVYTKEEGVQFFDEQASKYGERLEAAEARLKQFQKKWNIVDLQSQKSSNIELIAELKKELTNLAISYAAMQNGLDVLHKILKADGPDFLITREMRTIPSVVELEKSIVPLLDKRSEIASSFTPSSREYRDIDMQIDALRDEIRNEARRAIKTEELELNTLKVRIESLQERIKKLQEETSALNQAEKTLEALERDVDLLEKNYKLYASKTEDAKIYRERLKLDLANISIANRASIPVKPSFPNRMLMLILSIFLGTFAALGTPFIMEFLDRTFKIPEDIDDILSLPVICTLSEREKK